MFNDLDFKRIFPLMTFESGEEETCRKYIAILRLNECGQYVILKNEKQGRQDDYHYVPLPDCGDFNERYKKVKTQEAWALLRDKYKVKKGKYQYTNQDDRPASFSLLGQAVNEVIQKLEL